MQEPAISVVIPVYNTRAYVKECVDSVLAQTFRDFEILLVDDASTDGSLTLCRDLYGNLPQVRILAREKNGTVGAARNTGMEAARGKYIAFLDSDDLYMPNALECLYRTAEEHQADVVHSPGCYLPNGNIEHISVEDEFRTLMFDGLAVVSEPMLVTDEREFRVKLWAERKLYGTVWNKLFRRDFLQGHGIVFEEDIPIGEDAIFMFRCVYYAKRYLRIPEIFYIYRRPPFSATRRKRDAAFLADLIGFMVRKLRCLDRYMEETGFFHERQNLQEMVRQFVIKDTDPSFVQECYSADGSVTGDAGQVQEALERYFGSDAWLMGYYFHACHGKKEMAREVDGVGMRYVFPWHLLPEGCRVLIYGAGEVGRCFYAQASRFGFVQLAGIVDQNADSICAEGIPVRRISEIPRMRFDYILVSVINGKIVEAIRRDLVAMGIADEKILWDGKNYSVDDYYRNIYFPFLRSTERIVYGAGLNAQEYFRYLVRLGQGNRVVCFAVTKKEPHHPAMLCGKPLLSIEEATRKHSQAGIVVVLQEKYHGEVRELLGEMGKEAEQYIGLRRMTKLLGEEALREISGALPEFSVARKPKDYSMLYLCPENVPWKIYEFYPMTQVPLSGVDIQNMRKAMESGHDILFGRYPRPGNICCHEIKEPSLFIAMASSKGDAPVVRKEGTSRYLHRVWAGAVHFSGERKESCYYDDMGENISLRNPFYSELTVTYWLWKNGPETDYQGICHYRRHFVLTEEILGHLSTGAVDILLSRPRLTFPDVKSFLTSSASSMNLEDYRRMLHALRKRNPAEVELARTVAEGQLHFPNNMLIARREIFDDYCRWMFSILEDVERGYQEQGIERSARYIGYIGELLTTVFVAKNRGKYRMEYVDYELLDTDTATGWY